MMKSPDLMTRYDGLAKMKFGAWIGDEAAVYEVPALVGLDSADPPSRACNVLPLTLTMYGSTGRPLSALQHRFVPVNAEGREVPTSISELDIPCFPRVI